MHGAAIITGAANRIGKALTLSLARAGFDVIIHYNTSELEAKAVAEKAKEFGVEAHILRANLLNDREVKNVIANANKILGKPLTILINNASIFEYDTLFSATLESWDRHLASNLKAPLFLMQHFAKQVPCAVEDNRGEALALANIINIVDQRVLKKTPEFLTYSLAKMALWSLTQTSAQALAPNIRVNAIGPGPTLKGHRQSEEHFAAQRRNTILERGASPDEIAKALHFILNSCSLTGQLICIDGGQHLAWKTPDILGIE